MSNPSQLSQPPPGQQTEHVHPPAGLVGEIISRFERRGFKLAAMKLVSPGQAHLEEHYADLKEKSFFPGLIKYMTSGEFAHTP